jgi:hypothetical protein
LIRKQIVSSAKRREPRTVLKTNRSTRLSPYERAYFDPFEFEITRDAARPEDDRELFANMLPDALALRKRITATDDLAGVKIRAANHVPQVALIPCNVG